MQITRERVQLPIHLLKTASCIQNSEETTKLLLVTVLFHPKVNIHKLER